MLMLIGQELLPAGVCHLLHHPFQKNLKRRITKKLRFSFFPQRRLLLSTLRQWSEPDHAVPGTDEHQTVRTEET